MQRVRSPLSWAVLMVWMVALAGCATTYQKSSFTGGFDEKELEPGLWRIAFHGNGYASYETVQTYWLYRASEIALEQGYEGFEILSDLRLTLRTTPEHLFASPEGRMERTQVYYIPMDTGPKPSIEGDIRLLRAPIRAAPPRIFDAAQLKATLEPHVNGEKCSMGNVCPHPHKYIYGEGTHHES